MLRSGRKKQPAGRGMTMSVTNTVEDVPPLRRLLPLWVGISVYALMLLSGNRLLNDRDTMWQITVGGCAAHARTRGRHENQAVAVNRYALRSTDY
jgi:hypothetical protein